MTPLFISDLHLDASRPAATDCFLRFLAGPARDAGSLFILGDLFEAWTGDDATDRHDRTVISALRNYTTAGNKCSFLRGNRDFLVGGKFAAETGCTLLPDEALVEINGETALLMHGDTLCTADTTYQRYRKIVHTPSIQRLFLLLPAAFRSSAASYARRRSMQANAGKLPEIMDVSAASVSAALKRHGVSLLVHGHTHRPAVHSLEVEGRPARRIVLGDWYEQGSFLHWSANGPELATLSFA